jgi:hypothetical protein
MPRMTTAHDAHGTPPECALLRCATKKISRYSPISRDAVETLFGIIYFRDPALHRRNNKWPIFVSEHTTNSATYFSCGEPAQCLRFASYSLSITHPSI